MQPNKRLTAIEVLDTLSSIIATFKVPVNIGDEEQVVPEIELSEDKEEAEKTKNVTAIENITAFDKRLSEFSRQVTMQVRELKF